MATIVRGLARGKVGGSGAAPIDVDGAPGSSTRASSLARSSSGRLFYALSRHIEDSAQLVAALDRV